LIDPVSVTAAFILMEEVEEDEGIEEGSDGGRGPPPVIMFIIMESRCAGGVGNEEEGRNEGRLAPVI
jgi:hypothetical protein